MSAWASPGVKCVCIIGGPMNSRGFGYLGSLPVKGQTYVVRGWAERRAGPGDELGLCIVGLPNFGRGPTFSRIDFGWFPSRFRPLVTKTQEDDLAVFRPLLTSLPIREDAR